MHGVSFPLGGRSQPKQLHDDIRLLAAGLGNAPNFYFTSSPPPPPLVANVANHVGNCLLISGGEGTPTCDTNYHVTGAEREREIKVRVKNILERPLCPTGQYVLDLKNSFKAPGRLFKKQNFQIHICKKIKKIVQFFL